MAEGGRFYVEGDGRCIRLHLVGDGKKYVQKSVDGIGKDTLRGGEQFYSIECSVENAVSVDY